MAPGFVEFRLADGSSLMIEEADLRDVYDGLWNLSDRKGAISTAVLLVDEARKHDRYRQPVELTQTQSLILRQAVDQQGGARR
jgi:hypothetical protein